MSQLGKAYIEVKADLAKFPAELRAKLKAAMKEALAGVEFTELDKKAEHAGETAAEHVSTGFKRRSKSKLKEAGEDGGRSLLGGLRRIFTRNSSEGGGFFSSVGSFFKDAFSQAGQAASSGASAAGNVFSNIGGTLGKIGDVGGEVGSIVKIAAIAILIPVAIQLAGALVQLGAAIFALPAALGVAAAAVIPLVIAFQGFGEAVGAGLSGNVDQFNKALKGLPPSMRSVAKEVVGLKSVFSGVKTSIQQAFFAPLVGVVGPALRSIITTVTPGLARIASALGNVGASLLRAFSSPENLRTFAALMASTGRIVQTLEPTLTNLAQAMLNLIAPALPFLERGATAFRNFAATVEGFTNRIASSGQLTGWLERAGHILGSLISSVKLFGQYLITILGGEIGDNGTKFLDGFKEKLEQLVKFIQSPDGKETIHNLGVLLSWVGNIFLFLVGLVPGISKVLNDFFYVVRTISHGVVVFAGWLAVAAVAVGRFAVAVWGAIETAGRAVGHFFATLWRGVLGIGRAIGGFFTETIPSWWNSVVGFFQSLPGRVEQAFLDFAATGRRVIVNGLKSWYESVLEGVGNIIGIILGFPQIIALVWQKVADGAVAAWGAITAGIMTAVHAIVDFAVNGFYGFLGALGDIWRIVQEIFWAGIHGIEAAWDAIPGLLAAGGHAIWGFLVGLWNDVVVGSYNAVVNGFNRVIDFFSSLPQRIRELGPRLYQAAVDLGHKIGDGLANIGSFASDIGHKIVNIIKDGINWVIGSINNGIAEIDDKLPGTLPRIPKLARGAVVDSPTLALVGEAGPEVVVPLSNPKRAQELAEQSGLLSMLRGAGQNIVVNVVAYLDPNGVLIPMTKTIVNDTLNEQGEAMPYARAA